MVRVANVPACPRKCGWPGAEVSAYDDAKWEDIGLPHSFSMPYFAAGNAFYVGYGWYRKHFDLPANSPGRRLFRLKVPSQVNQSSPQRSARPKLSAGIIA